MAELEVAFRLPIADWPQAVFESDYAYDGGSLFVDGRRVLHGLTRAELEAGLDGSLPRDGTRIALRLVTAGHDVDVQLVADNRRALREDGLRAPPSRSAWCHACLALAGSAAGFVASYLYLLQAAALQSEWALKMGYHMAGWHLLLTFTLFPASVWGQRTGIRVVQFTSLLFFFIHVGIALANLWTNEAANAGEMWIGVFNAASGICFFIATIYGNRAYRDMDPVAALKAGRIAPARGVEIPGPELPHGV